MGLRYGDSAAIHEASAELEQLGYSALWIPDVGGDVFGAVARLLQATGTITIATGILNLWLHDPAETALSYAELSRAHPGRFLLGIGVSHAPLIDRITPGLYRRPLQAMSGYLDALDAAATPVSPDHRVLAALGPRMLELARQRAAGAHPYLTTPDHTAAARAALGPGKVLAPEQPVILERDPETARELGRKHLHLYLQTPNYGNSLRRLGFTEDDLADGGSDRLVDALVSWGEEADVAQRVRDHFDAGADHVCIQVVDSGDRAALPLEGWRRLAPVLLT